MIDFEVLMNKTVFLVFLTNVSLNRRIWDAFRIPRNLKVIEQILCNRDKVRKINLIWLKYVVHLFNFPP